MSIPLMKSQRRHGMTTHDEQINTTTSVPADQRSVPADQPSSIPADQPSSVSADHPSSTHTDADLSTTRSAPITATDEPVPTASSTAESGKPSDRSLFADNDLTRL